MTIQQDERFPHPKILVAERFGKVDKNVCTKCGEKLDDASAHFPKELGGGCIPGGNDCPMCGGLPGYCAEYCELSRLDR